MNTFVRRLPGLLTIVAAWLLAAASPGGALAGAGAKSADQCFAVRSIDGFNAPDDHTVYLRVGISDVYRLDLMTDCIDLHFKETLALENVPASPWICSPLDATVISRDPGFHQRCPVTAIHKLTPAELAALPKRDRP